MKKTRCNIAHNDNRIIWDKFLTGGKNLMAAINLKFEINWSQMSSLLETDLKRLPGLFTSWVLHFIAVECGVAKLLNYVGSV